MTDSGLTRRLRQQSHRSGLAVGISMALAIAVCFGGFTWLYVELDPWVRDFAGVEPAPTSTPRDSASANDQNDDEQSVRIHETFIGRPLPVGLYPSEQAAALLEGARRSSPALRPLAHVRRDTCSQTHRHRSRIATCSNDW